MHWGLSINFNRKRPRKPPKPPLKAPPRGTNSLRGWLSLGEEGHQKEGRLQSLHMRMHAHVPARTHIRTHTHACTSTQRMDTCTCTTVYTRMHVRNAHTHIHARTYATYAHTHTHTQVHNACMHVSTQLYTHARTYAMHANAHIHIHTRTHTCIRMVQLRGPEGPRLDLHYVNYSSVAPLALLTLGFINWFFSNFAFVMVPYGTHKRLTKPCLPYLTANSMQQNSGAVHLTIHTHTHTQKNWHCLVCLTSEHTPCSSTSGAVHLTGSMHSPVSVVVPGTMWANPRSDTCMHRCQALSVCVCMCECECVCVSVCVCV